MKIPKITEHTPPPEPLEILFDKCDSIRLLVSGLIGPCISIVGADQWVFFFRHCRCYIQKQLINSNLLIFYERVEEGERGKREREALFILLTHLHEREKRGIYQRENRVRERET